MKPIFLLIPLLVCAATIPRASAQTAPPRAVPPYVLSDAHFHYLDFVQETDGIDALVKVMDQAGVQDAMISGMSLVKKWDEARPQRPSYYLNDDSPTYWYSLTDEHLARAVKAAPPEVRARLHPFITGINPTDRNAVDHVRRMLDWHPDFWEGIGELFGHHDDLTALTYGETPRPNHIALDPIYALAAEHDLPVYMHSNVTSVGLPETLIFLPELEEALAKHPKTRFNWCHAGISRRIVVTNYTKQIAHLLNKYPNLWIDISWVVYPTYIAPNGVPDKDWVALIEQFPDRFMIGSDMVGHYQAYTSTMTSYYVLLDALKPETAKKVARENFLSILPKRVQQLRAAANNPGSPTH